MRELSTSVLRWGGHHLTSSLSDQWFHCFVASDPWSNYSDATTGTKEQRFSCRKHIASAHCYIKERNLHLK